MAGDPVNLGLPEILNRFEHLDDAVRNNVDRIGDHVQAMDGKLDELACETAKLTGALEQHLTADEQRRVEVSSRFRAVEFTARQGVVDAEARMTRAVGDVMLRANGATDMARETGKKRDIWRSQVVAVAAAVTLLLSALGVGYTILKGRAGTGIPKPVATSQP